MLNCLNGLELYNRPETELPKLLCPIILSKGLHLLTGSSDCGKSSWIRDLCLHIVTGKEHFLGFPLNTRTKSVAIISTEDTDDQYAINLKMALGQAENPEVLSRLKVIFEFDRSIEALSEFLTTNPVDLLVVDTWGDIFQGNPNDFTSVRQDLRKFKRLAMANNCAIILLHHNVKNSDKQGPNKALVNGSQAIEATPRCVLELRKGDLRGQRLLSILKSNYLSSAFKEQSLILNFDERTLRFSRGEGSISIQDKPKAKYNNELVIKRLIELKTTGISFENCRLELLKEFADSEVPGITRLKELYNAQKGTNEGPEQTTMT